MLTERVKKYGNYLDNYRCQHGDRDSTLLTSTVFEKTRQLPSTVVLIRRGIAKGESTARLARELKSGRARLHHRRQQIQHPWVARVSRVALADRVLAADERYQNAGEKKRAPSRSA